MLTVQTFFWRQNHTFLSLVLFIFFPLAFTTRVAECFSELNNLSSKNVTCYFHSRHKKLRHTGMKIQRYLIHFGNPTFNALSSFCASTTVPIIFTNDICDSEPHLKVKQEEAWPQKLVNYYWGKVIHLTFLWNSLFNNHAWSSDPDLLQVQ